MIDFSISQIKKGRGMIFSYVGQFAFVHIHKCAGESIEYSFSKVSRPSDLILGGVDWAENLQKRYSKEFGLRKHSTANDIYTNFNLEITNRFKYFCIVRNPIERALSTFYYLKYWKYPIVNNHVSASSFWESDDSNGYGPDYFLLAQHRYLPNDKAPELYRLEEISSLVKDLNEWLRPLGYKEMLLEYRNKTPIKYAEDISSDAREYLERRYEKDFILYENLRV